MVAMLISLPISDPILLSLSATLSVYLAESIKHAPPAEADEPAAA